MSRAEHAQELSKKVTKEIEDAKNSGFDDDRIKVDYLPTFKDGEKKVLRILPINTVLEWYLKNDEGECENDGFPYAEVFKHWKVGTKKAQMSCLSKHLNEPCPVCELIEELKETGDEEDKKYASEMWAKARYLWFVIDRGAEDGEKPYAWEVSRTVYRDLLRKFGNTRIPDLDHIFEGTDIEVTREGTGKDTEYDIEDAREVTYLFTTEDGKFDYEAGERLLANLPNLTEYVAPFLNYDESAALMNGEALVDILKARNGDSEETEEPKEEPKEEAPKGRGRGRGRK